jgi:hypothetical protein
LDSDEQYETLQGVTVQFSKKKTADEDWKLFVLNPDVEIIDKIEASSRYFFCALSRSGYIPRA